MLVVKRVKEEAIISKNIQRVSLFIVALFALVLGPLAMAQKTLTIQNANGVTAATIELADSAQVNFRITNAGVVLGLPVGLTFTCQGTTTANGSCDATAGSSAGSYSPPPAAADADSDGVPDSSDNCPNTPAGAFVDSAGCAESQKDADGDGVMNSSDQCANTPPNTDVDATGCPTQTTTTTTTTTGAYCDPTPSGVECSPSNNLDTWWERSGSLAQSTPRAGILALPFSTRESSRDGGRVSFTTYESAFIDDTRFRSWISETPGGKPINASNGQCNSYVLQARSGFYWTQNPRYASSSKFCYLGEKARTLYLNFEACVHSADGLSCTTSRLSGYRFDVSRAYRAY